MLVVYIKIWKSHLNIREGSDYIGPCRVFKPKTSFYGNDERILPKNCFTSEFVFILSF